MLPEAAFGGLNMSMSGETMPASQMSGWTTDTLHELMLARLNDADTRYQQRFDASQQALQAALIAQKEAVAAALLAQQNAVSAALASADRAVLKAENASERRFESVNEFRASLNDSANRTMTRTETSSRFDAMSEKIEDLRARQAENNGKSQTWIMVGGGMFSVLTLVIAIVAIFWHQPSSTIGIDSKRVDDMVSRLNSMSERLNSVDKSK